MNKPHKHAELIKAWADGAEIQFKRQQEKEWQDAGPNPSWYECFDYRIKPQPKPDVVDLYLVHQHCLYTSTKNHEYNLKLTFDGETGKLKSAEVL